MEFNQPVFEYLAEVKQQFATGHALEHGYRPALQQLLSSLKDTVAVNDPKHSDHGAPDFVLLKASNTDIILGYGEAKQLSASLDKLEDSDQFHRYAGYEKLFTTNYLEFRFYENGILVSNASIGTVKNATIVPSPDGINALWHQLNDFIESTPTTIKSGKELARIMGAKARRIRDEVRAIIDFGDSEQERLRKTMKKMLVHDLDKDKFADLYAQTLVYGLFVASFNDPTPSTFSREEARGLVPSANPFLRTFFDHIAGANFEDKLRRTVDELCQVFEVTDLVGIFAKYSTAVSSRAKDPVIYFYEDFLNSYDPRIRKEMGAFYTPLPVVHFIIKMINEALVEHFDAPMGLADTSKRTVEIDDGQLRKYRDRETNGIKRTTKQRIEYHRIQILDPAVGTGTFLNEAVKSIYSILDQYGQSAMWDDYVSTSLLPRLHGFEYMMAPYTIGHLKLGLTLAELGYQNNKNTRLSIYLTNSLEPGIPQPTDLFSLIGLSEAISQEANLASVVKNEKPLLIILGNPPYLGESNNDTEYAEALTEKYKFEPGTDMRLKESNYKWLRNDYVKFIAMAQERIDALGEGIIGMITPNSYLSQPTFRGMRYSLLKSFDHLYILDLGGNLHSRDTTEDGKADQNVFDIETGVSILIAVKSPNLDNEIAEVELHRVKGTRATKFDFLETGEVEWEKCEPREPMYAFRLTDSADTSIAELYSNFIPLKKLFPLHSLGILTKRDKLSVGMSSSELTQKLTAFLSDKKSTIEACAEFNLKIKDKDKWDAENVRAKYTIDELTPDFQTVHYRPFDQRIVVYNSDLIARTNSRVLAPLKHDNLALIVGRQGQAVKDMEWNLSFIAKTMTDQNIFGRGGGTVFPLYAISDESQQLPNIDTASREKLLTKLSHEVSPIDIFHYVYGVLSLPEYRRTFSGFLKDDFPRIPIPQNDAEFEVLRTLGKELTELHTEEKHPQITTSFPITGSNTVDKYKFDAGRIYINKDQYIDNVPESAWNYYIGGYSVIQKWLKERKGRALNYEDVLHLQNVIAILSQSRQLMESTDTSAISWLK